jgi:hypothetical protein
MGTKNNKRNGAADATQAVRGCGEKGGDTSITTTGTGERDEQQRACCTSTAAITAPISGERLDAPAELVGSAADGAIGATGTAMEQQMDGPATTALKQSRGDARLRPDEITTTASDDDDRAMGERRRRQEARERQCSGLGHCSRGQAHGLQSKRTEQVFRGFRCRRRWARGLWR